VAQMINLVVFEGYLGADAEVKTIGNGKSVVNYRVAHTRRYKTGDGQQRDETTWMTVVDWKPSAANLAKYLTKGRNVKVIGRMQARDYEDKQGNKRTSYEIIAEDVLLGSDGKSAAGVPVAAGAAPSANYDWDQGDEEETKPW
jgi:single-strand DNA-binding protein